MNKFSRTQISLAVGAALAFGSVSVVYGAAPTLRGTNPAVTAFIAGSNASDINKRALLSATGLAGQTLTVTVNITNGGGATAGANLNGDIHVVQASVAATPDNATANTLVVANNTALTFVNNNVNVYTGTLAVATQLPVTSATFVPGAVDSANASIDIVLSAPAGIGAYRLNAGNLEFSATPATAASFAPVKIDVQSAANGSTAAADRQIYTEADNTSGFTAGVDLVIAATLTVSGTVKSALAPTPTLSTTAAALAAKINGFSVDTGTPIALVTGNLLVSTRAVGSVTVAGAIPAAAVTVGTCAVSKCAVTLGLGVAAATGGVDLVAGAVAPITDAADVTAYDTATFNTGVNGATVAFTVDGTATQAAYTEVFNVSDGLAAKLALAGTPLGAGISAAFAAPGSNNITDGAAPSIVSAVVGTAVAGIAPLTLTFSEPLALINATLANNLTEVAENVKVGVDSLAALNLNAGSNLSLSALGVVNGQGTLTINGVAAADVTSKSVSVSNGISVLENNDPGFSATVPAIDGAVDGGIVSASLEFLSAAATAVTSPPLTVGFANPDVTASAPTTVADATKVGSVVVKFAAGKEVTLNPAVVAKTLTDLANDLVIKINGQAGHAPILFEYHPVAADLTLNAAGDTLTIVLPTALIYSKIDAVTRIDVTYATSAVGLNPVLGGAALVSKTTTTTLVAAGTVKATLPLSATATASPLLTQNIIGTLSGASNGSLVHAYLAKWKENPSSTPTGSTLVLKGGKVSRAGDALMNGIAVGFGDNADAPQNGGNGRIAQAMKASRDAEAAAVTAIPGVRDAALPKPPKPITIYGVMQRSNDIRANGNGTQSGNNGGGDLLQAGVFLDTFQDNLTGWSGANDPVFELTLDPVTGNITGALTGNLVFTYTLGTSNPGLTVVGEIAQGLVDSAGKFNLLAGTDAATTATLGTGPASLADTFLILVHEDQTNTRTFTQLTSANPGSATYLPWAPNLVTLAATRTVLGVAPGIAGTVATGAAVPIALSNYQVGINNGANLGWTIRSARNPANAAGTPAGASFPRSQVGLSAAGAPVSIWTGGGSGLDMAMTMTNSKVFLATGLGVNKGTLSTITSSSYTPGSVAFAFKSDGVPAASIAFASPQAAAVAAKVGPGWSLVSVPSGGTISTSTADAVIRAATATGQFTWLKADGAMPTLTAGEGVFVFSAKGGAL